MIFVNSHRPVTFSEFAIMKNVFISIISYYRHQCSYTPVVVGVAVGSVSCTGERYMVVMHQLLQLASYSSKDMNLAPVT